MRKCKTAGRGQWQTEKQLCKRSVAPSPFLPLCLRHASCQQQSWGTSWENKMTTSERGHTTQTEQTTVPQGHTQEAGELGEIICDPRNGSFLFILSFACHRANVEIGPKTPMSWRGQRLWCYTQRPGLMGLPRCGISSRTTGSGIRGVLGTNSLWGGPSQGCGLGECG